MNNRGKGALAFASALAIALSFAGGPLAKTAYAGTQHPTQVSTDDTTGTEGTDQNGSTEAPATEQKTSDPSQDYTTPPVDIFGNNDKKSYELYVEVVDGDTDFFAGDSGQFTVTIDGKSATEKELKKVKWASNDEGIMTVDKDGKFTCVAGGDVEISATYSGSTVVMYYHVDELEFDYKPTLTFDGVQFVYSLEMKDLNANGFDYNNYVVESWVDDSSLYTEAGGVIDTTNPTYKAETPTAADFDTLGFQTVSPKDLAKYVHYRISYPGYVNPDDGSDTVGEYVNDVDGFFHKKNDDAIQPIKRVAFAAVDYSTLMNNYFFGQEFEGTKCGYLVVAKESVKDTVVPDEFAPKVENNSTLVANTKSHIEFGDTAKIKYTFTPDPGILARHLEFTVDGQSIVPGKKFVNEATGATITVTEQKDHTMLLVIAGIKPADMDHSFIVTAGRGENNVKTIDCSVNSHMHLIQNTEGIGDVAKALYNYGVAANDYFAQ